MRVSALLVGVLVLGAATSTQAQGVKAVAPVGTSASSLGQLYDANFRPLRARVAFDSPEQVPEARTYREIQREASSLQVRASARVWGVGAEAAVGASHSYGYVRAIALERVIQVPPTQEIGDTPPGAAYFVSKIYFGRMYELHVSGTRRAVAARISYLTASAQMTASSQSATAEGYTIGLAPRGGDIVAAMSAASQEEITARFQVSGPAAPILLEFERVPETRAPPLAETEPEAAGGTYQISVVSLEFPGRKPNNMPWDGMGGPDMRVVFSQRGRNIRVLNAPRNQTSARFTHADLGRPVSISAANPLRLDFYDVDLAMDDSAGFKVVTSLRDGDNALTSNDGARIVLRVVRVE